MRTFNALPALALLACSGAHAEPYTLPTDAWYQVARGDTIVCQSGSACDLDLSQRYRLLRFTLDGVTESEIGGTSSTGTSRASVTRVVETCVFNSPDPGDCVARCPADTMLTGGSCAARTTALVGGDTNPSGEVIATADYAQRDAYGCLVRVGDVPDLGGIGAAFVTVAAMCLTR